MAKLEAMSTIARGEQTTRASAFDALGAKIRRWIQTQIWGMDIHPSARIPASAHLDRTWPRGVHIGADTQLGPYVIVLAHDAARGLMGDTRIGARCVLGARAIVMPTVRIGDDCLVMPAAVVTKDMPANSIAIGKPAITQPRPAL